MFRIFIIGLVLFALTSASYAEDMHGKKVLSMGRTTENVAKQQKKIEPIITYLASKLKDMGIEKGEVVLAGDREFSTLTKLIKDGKLDIIIESPFKTAKLKREGTAAPILTLSRKGSTEYNSLIFARKDSGIKGIEDLKGKIIAFEDPTSTSAYFIPKAMIMAKGLDMAEVSSFNAVVPKDKVGYVFAGTELNISSWVFYKKTAAGAFSNINWNTAKYTPETYKKELNIIYESPMVSGFFVLIRNGLDKKLAKRIKEELLNMDKTDEGKKALSAYEFDRFIDSPEKIDNTMKYIESLMKSIKEDMD